MLSACVLPAYALPLAARARPTHALPRTGRNNKGAPHGLTGRARAALPAVGTPGCCVVAANAGFQRPGRLAGRDAPGAAGGRLAAAPRRRQAGQPPAVRTRLRGLPPDAVRGAASLFASAIGWVMGAGSALLYAPILLRLLRARSADGMTVWTWVLQLVAFAVRLHGSPPAIARSPCARMASG